MERMNRFVILSCPSHKKLLGLGEVLHQFFFGLQHESRLQQNYAATICVRITITKNTTNKNTKCPTRLTSRNVLSGKESDAKITIHRPLLCLAVRFATVVHKARKVASWPGVNNPQQTEQSVRSIRRLTEENVYKPSK